MFYVAFNSQGHIATGSLQVEETSAYAYKSITHTERNHRASASNYQLSNMKSPAQDSNRQPQRLEARTLTAKPPSPPPPPEGSKRSRTEANLVTTVSAGHERGDYTIPVPIYLKLKNSHRRLPLQAKISKMHAGSDSTSIRVEGAKNVDCHNR